MDCNGTSPVTFVCAGDGEGTYGWYMDCQCCCWPSGPGGGVVGLTPGWPMPMLYAPWAGDIGGITYPWGGCG